MRRGRPPIPELLTPREQEVLSLIREGLTNEQIAERLGVSESGARYHVSKILSKLGVENRHEVARWQPKPEVSGGRGLITAFNWKLGGIGAIGVAAVAIALLALGLALMESRGAEGPSPEASSESRSAETEALMALAAEAEAEAQTFLVDPLLHFIAYPETSGIYTFAFHQPGSRVLVAIVGPNTGDPTLPLWEVHQDVLAAGPALPELLDLDRLQHGLDEIMDAVRASHGYAGELAILLWPEAGGVRWYALPAVGTSRSVPFECRGNQDLPASISCAVPTPTP